MRRREFLGLVGGAIAAWPRALRAQQAKKLPTIGYLGGTVRSTDAPWLAAFVHRLHELGWIEDRTVAIEYRWASAPHRGFRLLTLTKAFRLAPVWLTLLSQDRTTDQGRTGR